MIIDSHCHAWKIWPYLPEVPDPESHGSIEILLNKLTQNNVDLATIVCAEIFNNFDNNLYIYNEIKNYPNKFLQLVDIDSMWSETYHTSGATKRLESAIKKYKSRSFKNVQKQGKNNGTSQTRLSFCRKYQPRCTYYY